MEMAQAAVSIKKDGAPAVTLGPANDGVIEMFDSLARRAFEIFQSNGHPFGNDLADWLQAEREMFHAAHVDVSESDQAFTVTAEMPGFTAKDLEISLDGRRLTIAGKREKHEEKKEKKTIYSETCSDQVLRVVDLPADVNAEGTNATLKDGILRLDIPKAAPPKKVAVTPKA
jgi:HSP20 family protein